MLIAYGCGKRGVPLPPTERVQQRLELNGFQRGDTIILSWRMPARNADKGSLLNISRVDIYRLAEPASSGAELSEEEFASRSVLIASVPVTDSDFALASLTYRDRLEFAGQAARLRYAIRAVNASSQKAAFSNFLLIEPVAGVAAAPTSLAFDVSQEAVTLTWAAPAANVDGSRPVNLLGYNVYRSASPKEPGRLLNRAPVRDERFADEFFEFGKDHYYFVRAVSSGPDGGPLESGETNIIHVKPVDTFAPSAPSSISLAAGQNVISIFFAVNPEKDVAGYKIYRSTDPGRPRQEWQLLTPEAIKTNTFQDRSVESGVRYHYFIIAIDTSGNVSPPSEIVSESAP
ncbi:MAG: fibronectin type III domain-containing protein [Pyrinomonadaceae bacterium]